MNISFFQKRFGMNSNKVDIVFLINSLCEGGAARVMVTLAKAFEEEGENVTILALTKNNFYKVPKNVKIVYLSEMNDKISGVRKLFYIPYHAWKLKSYIRKNKVLNIQSYLFRANFVNLLASVFGAKHNVQVANRSVVSRFFKEGISGRINILLTKVLYPNANLIIHLSERMKLDFHESFNIKANEVVIYNPYDVSSILKQSNEKVENFRFNPEKRYLLSIGRLIALKRFQDIIHVLSFLPEDIELVMLGEGEEEKNLRLLVKKLSLDKRVHFLGQVKNPFQYMKHCEMFISSSSIEGFPNVLVEAMLCKTAVISSDCISGPREILAPSTKSTQMIVNDIEMADFGILYKVGDTEGLRKAIYMFLENSVIKESYIEKAFEQAKLYSVENISTKYKSLF